MSVQERLFDLIEDAEAGGPVVIDAAKVLSDEELGERGLVAVKAFVRTRVSKSAIRSAKHKAKAAVEGRKQVNFMAPAEQGARDALKALGQALLDGKATVAAVSDLARGRLPPPPSPRPVQASAVSQPQMPDPFAMEVARLRAVLVAGGWRALLLRRLLR